MRSAALAGSCLFMLACPPAPGDATTDDATTGDATTGDTTTGDSTTEPLDASEQHGFVCLRFAVSEGHPPALPDADMGFEVRMQYNQCLIDFYEQNPEYSIDFGLEGIDAFMDAANSLHAMLGVDGLFAHPNGLWGHATVSQEPDRLWISYIAPDPAAMAGGKLLFGPVPLQTLTDCVPAVSLTDADAVRSPEFMDMKGWRLETFATTALVPAREPATCLDVVVGEPFE